MSLTVKSQENPEKSCQTTKEDLAKWFRVGIRTIEEWTQEGIILGRRVGRRLRFDLLECNRRIFLHANSSQYATNRERTMDTTEQEYATKAELAKRYGVAIRTIGNWQRAGLLTFFKIRRVVRFQLKACDEALHAHNCCEPTVKE